MPIEANCPECHSLLRFKDEHEGRDVRCPSCSTTFSLHVSGDDSRSLGTRRPFPLQENQSPSSPRDLNPYKPNDSQQSGAPPSADWTPRRISHDEVLHTSWAIFRKEWSVVCTAIAALALLLIAFLVGQYAIIISLQWSDASGWVMVAAHVLLHVFGVAIQTWLHIGQILIVLDVVRGQPVVFSKLLGGGPFLATSVITLILLYLVILGVAVALVGIPAAAGYAATGSGVVTTFAAVAGGAVATIPIVVLLLMFSQFQMLIIDRQVGPFEALSRSRQLTNGNKLTLLLISLMLMMIGGVASVVGLLALVIGVIPAMLGSYGYGAVVFVVVYLSMTGQPIAIPRQNPSVGAANAPSPDAES